MERYPVEFGSLVTMVGQIERDSPVCQEAECAQVLAAAVMTEG